MTELIVFLVVVLIAAGIHAYVWVRLVREPGLPRGITRATAIAGAVLSVAVPVVMGFSTSAPRDVVHPYAVVAFAWLGALFLLLVLLGTTDVVRAAAWLVRRMRGTPVSPPERRRFLARVLAACTVVIGLGEGAFGAVQALGAVRVERLRIALRRWPQACNGMSLVQLSDMHIGPTLGRPFVEGIVARVNELTPDIVAITGDLVDGSVEDLRAHIAPLADLRARLGVFFVTGNHEYYSGAPEWIAELRRIGVRVLENERVSLGEEPHTFDLAGVNDYNAPGGGHDVARALAGRDVEREVILLAHQPRSVREAAEHGVGLQLSGHTHGGQIFPWNFLVKLGQPFVAGLHRMRETIVYVSRGTGFWGPPLRVGAPPEITFIELWRA